MHFLPELALWTLVGVAAVWDLAQRRIPNALVLTGLLLGIAFSTQASGFAGLGSSILGAAVALAVLIIPFHFRLLGGGDVKLAMVCGAFLGWRSAIDVILVASVAHGVVTLIWMLAARVAANFGRTLDLQKGIPHAVAFAIATVATTLGWISIL